MFENFSLFKYKLVRAVISQVCYVTDAELILLADIRCVKQ